MTEKKELKEPAKGIPIRQIVIEIEGTTKIRMAKEECASDFETVAVLQFIINWIHGGRK